ncbi:uncharacterized protein [Watersipora subatra]|uniref:uncharacterized protein isoform X1 n=1 Tax=Watersipora subatra TaxID=2589382 RepID=UPI00355C886A
MANLRKTLEDLKSIPDALLKQWDSLTGCQENAECVCKERYKNCQENEKHCKQETDLLRRKHKSLQGQTNELKSCVATLEDEACSVNHKITGIEHRLDDVQSSVDKNMPYGRAERNQPSDSLIEAVQARDPG